MLQLVRFAIHLAHLGFAILQVHTDSDIARIDFRHASYVLCCKRCLTVRAYGTNLFRSNFLDSPKPPACGSGCFNLASLARSLSAASLSSCRHGKITPLPHSHGHVKKIDVLCVSWGRLRTCACQSIFQMKSDWYRPGRFVKSGDSTKAMGFLTSAVYQPDTLKSEKWYDPVWAISNVPRSMVSWQLIMYQRK